MSRDTTWTYNGTDLALDLQDAETAKRYEDAFAEMMKEEKAIEKTGTLSEAIESQCRMFRHLFDRIFGEGTSTALFGERNNAGDMMDAYEDFLTFVKAQSDRALEQRNRMIARFNPNRAERDKPKKKG